MTMIRRAALALLALWPASAWAQAENIAKGVDVVAGAANGIASEGGLLGKVAVVALGVALLLLGIACYAIVMLFKRLQDAQDKRAAEGADGAKQVAATSIAGTSAIAEASSRAASLETKLQTLSDKLSRLPEDLARGLANQDAIAKDIRGNGEVMRETAKSLDTLAGRLDVVLRQSGRAA